ncbi:MAG: dUTP diphosphatase [Clostridia bacterium]|nr:dUTP diphosphatase [Clostridia bacterium]
MQTKVFIKKTDARAILPTYGSEYAAGADLYALTDEPVQLAPHTTAFLHTGIAMELPQGLVGLVFARSGLACKQDLAPANKVGVIDCDYRGEIMVAMHNHGSEVKIIENGERIAQLVITPYVTALFEEKDSLSETVRSDGGFGSTGK